MSKNVDKILFEKFIIHASSLMKHLKNHDDDYYIWKKYIEEYEDLEKAIEAHEQYIHYLAKQIKKENIGKISHINPMGI